MKTDLMRADINGGSLLSLPSPRPSRSCQNEERGKTRAGVLTQGSSFLATAGLICETRFGVFKMVRHNHE
jgi:hypothetical protein